MWAGCSRIKRRIRASIILVLAVILLLILLPKKLHKKVILEAGSEIPGISQFLKNTKVSGEFITDMDLINTKEIGIHEIKIKIGKKIYKSKLLIEDTIPPKAEIEEKEIALGETIDPEDFLIRIDDVTKVKVSFVEEPDFSRQGEQKISIQLEDEGKNKTIVDTSLYIGKVKRLVKVEAGSEGLDISQFMLSDRFTGNFITDIGSLNLSKLGKQDIVIEIDGEELTTQMEIIDTIPPKGDPVNYEAWVGESVDPEKLVENIRDFTNVKVFFKKNPDIDKVGSQDITLVLEDEAGNQTELIGQLTLKEDREPPKIIGVMDQTVYIGERISYKKGISVVDNKDENLEFEIDSSKVNLKQVGSYEVVYTAKDKAGNKARETATIIVKTKPKDYVTESDLYELADQILAKIIKPGMSDIDKAWEIYRWTRGHIKYVNDSDKTNWVKEGVRGIQKARGDCFTYYATSKALLTRAGFENIRLDRVSDTSFHVWHLVKFNGNWYHFDTTPSRTGFYYVTFLRTDAEVEEYSTRCIDYFKFDKSKYPATPTKKIQHPRNYL